MANEKELIPLYYAIIKHFLDGTEACADDVVTALSPNYGNYKLLTHKDVEEALATAKENGLLDESNYGIDEKGQLQVYYKVTDFGLDMMDRYIGKYNNPE